MCCLGFNVRINMKDMISYIFFIYIVINRYTAMNLKFFLLMPSRVLSRSFSVGIGGFVIGLGQISFFFSLHFIVKMACKMTFNDYYGF